MPLEQATDLLRQSLLLALLLAMPMLLMGLLVGVLISIMQAVTQIQEQTLTFVPKISIMIIAAVVTMPWMGTRLMEYATSMFLIGQSP